jgi:hypothetical protein
VSAARRRRASRPANAATEAATIAMFQPEIATTWLAPAVVKSAASARSTRSRSPMRMPAASPASGSGIDRVSAAADSRRSRSRNPDTPADDATTVIDRARSVAATPVRRR